jgi:hypothetical protein
MGLRKRLQFEDTEGAPIAAEKADDGGTTIEKIRKSDETAAPAPQSEQRRHFTGFYGIGDKPHFGELLDRAPHSRNHVRCGVRLKCATACFKLRLQRDRAPPDKRGGRCDASLIAADLRHPCRGNIVYS